jgi:hypothetical protein
VQKRLAKAIPGVNIETQEVTYKRYGGKLRISHGHLFPTIDPANGFKNWKNPILSRPKDSDPKRLEMCAGTLFVVRFVNYMEAKYPFADNLHPEIALMNILAREDKFGLLAVAWVMSRFVVQFHKAALSADHRGADIGPILLEAIQTDSFVRQQIASLYNDVLGQPGMTTAKVKETLASEDAVAEFIEKLMQTGAPWEKWLEALNAAKPDTLSIGEAGSGTLSIAAAAMVSDIPAACLTIAEGQWKAGAEIVVLGHTNLRKRSPRKTRKRARRRHVFITIPVPGRAMSTTRDR